MREKLKKKLGLNYYITLDYFKKKLNKMLCISNNQIDSYMNYLSEAPFIPEFLENKVVNYLNDNKQYIKKYNFKYTIVLIHKLKKFISNPIFSLENKNFKLWLKRNNQCRIIISLIYSNMACGDYDMIQSFKTDNILHLKLFYMGCTIISEDILQKLL